MTGTQFTARPAAAIDRREVYEGPRPRLPIAFDAFLRRQNPLLYLGFPDAMARLTGPRWVTLNVSAEEIA